MKTFILLAPLALIACTTNGAAGIADAVGSKPPVTCAATTGDEKAVRLAADGVDALALSLSALAKTPLLVPGSATALKLKVAINDARNGVNTAELAREACNANTYSVALAKAQAAITSAKSLFGGL